MKLSLKLLILITLIATVAAPVGWKWGAKPKTAKALTYAIAPAAVSTPDPSTSPDTSLAPADATAPDSSTSPGTYVNPDGWTWDTGE